MKKRNPKPSAATRTAKAEPARIPHADAAEHEIDRSIEPQKQGISTRGEEEQRRQSKVVPIRSETAHTGKRKPTASRRNAS